MAHLDERRDAGDGGGARLSTNQKGNPIKVRHTRGRSGACLGVVMRGCVQGEQFLCTHVAGRRARARRAGGNLIDPTQRSGQVAERGGRGGRPKRSTQHTAAAESNIANIANIALALRQSVRGGRRTS